MSEKPCKMTKRDTPQTKVGLALLLILRSLHESQPELASIPGSIVRRGIVSGTLTVDPDWTLSLDLKVHDRAGTLIKESSVSGMLVRNGNTIQASFDSVVTPRAGD